MSLFSRIKADVEGIISNIHAELAKLEGIAVAKEQQATKQLEQSKVLMDAASDSAAVAADARSVVSKVKGVL